MLFLQKLVQISVIHLCVLVCSLLFISCNDQSGPLLSTKFGQIQGSILTSDNGLEFFAFRGIPFAKPPVKNLRFKAPETLNEKWEGVLDATDDGNICIQYDLILKAFMGDEDCLYLNVYTPKYELQSLTDPLPVMVWIHGGGFGGGSGMSSIYGPNRLMDRDNVILVTVNYRVGPFGFLSTLDDNSPGNYGLLDQVMALQWVHDNIAAFRGDPNRVTIFGESAGSASVGLHLISPLSKGLFHAAITQSGSILSDWVTPFDQMVALTITKELAESLKCPIDCNKEMMRCLMKRPALDIIMKCKELKGTGDIILFRPVVDKLSRGEENSFLLDFPRNLIAKEQFTSVPVMTGVTQDEGALILEVYAAAVGGVQFYGKEHLPAVLKVLSSTLAKQGRRVLREIIDGFFENVDETNLKQKIAAMSNFLSDVFITYKVDIFNDFLARFNVPIYVYKFAHRGQHSIVDSETTRDKVSHADDLQYLFRCVYFQNTTLSGEDKKMADIMTILWTNFAKTKVPSLDGSAVDHKTFKWEPMTSGNPRYLELDLTPTMVNGHLSANYDFWKLAYSGSPKDEL